MLKSIARDVSTKFHIGACLKGGILRMEIKTEKKREHT